MTLLIRNKKTHKKINKIQKKTRKKNKPPGPTKKTNPKNSHSFGKSKGQCSHSESFLGVQESPKVNVLSVWCSHLDRSHFGSGNQVNVIV